MTDPRTTPTGSFPCPSCDGDGWYVGHSDECYETGDCHCSGVQVWCQECEGTGQVATRPLRDVVNELEEMGL